jgi:hypothetical protein
MKNYISQNLLNSLASINAYSQLCGNNVLELYMSKNKTFIILGSVSNGNKGTVSLTAYECVLFNKFKGKGISFAQYGFDVIDGKKEDIYSNIIFKHKKVDWVIIGEPISFLPIKESKQLDFF